MDLYRIIKGKSKSKLSWIASPESNIEKYKQQKAEMPFQKKENKKIDFNSKEVEKAIIQEITKQIIDTFKKK